jgi:hypothetical protein
MVLLVGALGGGSIAAADAPGGNGTGSPTNGPKSNVTVNGKLSDAAGSATMGSAVMNCVQTSVSGLSGSFTLNETVDVGSTFVVYLVPNNGSNANPPDNVSANYAQVTIGAGDNTSGTVVPFSISITSPFTVSSGGILIVFAVNSDGTVISSSKSNSLNCTEATATPTASPTPTATATATAPPTATPAVPSITTNAVATALVGQAFHDTATLSGGDNPTGTISFTLYGPSDSASCTTNDTIGTVHVTVNGDGIYQSPDMTVGAAGTYWWIARYNPAVGSNNVSVRNSCGDTAEMTVVSPAATATPTVAPSSTPTEAPSATPTEPVSTPTLPPTGGSPTPTVAPASGSPSATPTGAPVVLPASGSPSPTLPNTALSLPGSGNSGQGPILPLVLLAMGGLAFGIMLLKPTPVRQR